MLTLLIAGCAAPGDRPTTDAETEEVDEQLALLEALPYADWDETAAEVMPGIAHRNPDRSWDGINLYTNRETEAYLMDMDGHRLHTWQLPPESSHCGYFELLERGEIVALCRERWLVRVDRDSNLVWKAEIPVHHDFYIFDDGDIAVLIKEEWRQYKGRLVQFGGLVWLTSEGELRDTWLAFEYLEELMPFHPISRLERPAASAQPDGKNQRSFDYYHWNTLEILPDTPLGRADARFREGNFLLCPRNVNTIVILDQESMLPVWSWGGDHLSMPHMPTMLPNGNILIFDNGVRNRRSRILEIEPPSGEIVWKYPQEDYRAFFSFSRGSNQRLPNGNTLICASDRGHAFEITPDGERVWEFWNPERQKGKRKAIYRLMRMSKAEVARRMRDPVP